MGTQVTHDIGERLEVTYCLHGEGEFVLKGITGAELDFVGELSPEQATQLFYHLRVWLEAMPCEP